MYIRESRTTNRKMGAIYTSYKLVESYRSEGGPRQRVVMSIASIAAAAEQAMLNFDFHQLREQDLKDRIEGKKWTSVDLQSVGTVESCSMGPELVRHTMWQRLQMPEFLASLGWTETQRSLAEAVVVGRLVAPSSDLATWSWLRERTALVELLEADVSEVGKAAVYEVADELLEHKTVIESALRARETLLFPAKPRLFLYDLTNGYMEGSAFGNSLAKYGRSKEQRSDCPLITFALLVDEFGFPVFSQVHGGNQSEPETLENIVERLVKEEPRRSVRLTV